MPHRTPATSALPRSTRQSRSDSVQSVVCLESYPYCFIGTVPLTVQIPTAHKAPSRSAGCMMHTQLQSNAGPIKAHQVFSEAIDARLAPCVRALQVTGGTTGGSYMRQGSSSQGTRIKEIRQILWGAMQSLRMWLMELAGLVGYMPYAYHRRSQLPGCHGCLGRP